MVDITPSPHASWGDHGQHAQAARSPARLLGLGTGSTRPLFVPEALAAFERHAMEGLRHGDRPAGELPEAQDQTGVRHRGRRS